MHPEPTPTSVLLLAPPPPRSCSHLRSPHADEALDEVLHLGPGTLVQTAYGGQVLAGRDAAVPADLSGGGGHIHDKLRIW